MDNCKEIKSCLCCTGENLRLILDLGAQSPANNYNVKDKFPLRLNVCMDCSHAQLSHSVDPKILFKDYPYLSGVSETMKAHYKWFAEYVLNFFTSKKCGSVFEIACNDGSQLDEFKKLGLLTSGIDPAENVVPIAREKGHEVLCDYFGSAPMNSAQQLIDIVVAQNVIAHTPDPSSMITAAKKLMHKDSLLCLQTSQAKMIENHQFDTIYHEHISFFNRRSFTKLFNRHHLEVVDYKFLPEIHGGSDLYILKKMPEISILDYSDFSNRSYKFANEFRNKIEEIQKTGTNIICYGAAAKMINLIRFTGIKPDYICDDTPTKIGNFIERIYVNRGEFLNETGGYIIPVWNFYDEIKAKVEKQHPGKFKFIKYIPEITIE